MDEEVEYLRDRIILVEATPPARGFVDLAMPRIKFEEQDVHSIMAKTIHTPEKSLKLSAASPGSASVVIRTRAGIPSVSAVINVLGCPVAHG